MQPTTRTKSPRTLRTASTSMSSLPSTPQLLANKLQKLSQPAQEIAALHSKINGSSQSLAELKVRSRELRAKAADKKREIAKMDELHQYCQKVIPRNEKEIAACRSARSPGPDLKQRKSELLSIEISQFADLKDQVQSHICTIESLEEDLLPASHSDQMANVMLSQRRLFLSQLRSQEAAFLQLLSNLSKQEEVAESAIASIQRELALARSQRSIELIQAEKRKREGDFESARRRSGKSLDLRSAETSLGVVRRLKEKVAGKDSEFLQSLETRLKKYGLPA